MIYRMRFIYTDEAGIAANEPVTVVVGIIVNADTQWVPTVGRIFEVLKMVPEKFRDEFVFHATSIWADHKYRPNWSFEARLEFLKRMMSIPRESGLPITYGMFYRDGTINPDVNLTELKMTREQYQHVHAFEACMASADDYINTYAAVNEISVIVAEDIPEMRQRLREATIQLRTGGLTIKKALVTRQVQGKTVSTSARPAAMQIRRVVDDIHFSPKVSALILWVADAVAYGLRRYYATLPFGVDFAQAIMGPTFDPIAREKDCAAGYMCNDPPTENPFATPIGSC
jgi:hypothetical protein